MTPAERQIATDAKLSESEPVKMHLSVPRGEAPDYLHMTAPEMLAAVRDDAGKWADAFCQACLEQGVDLAWEWVVGWFANAIEHSHNIRTAPSHPGQLTLALPQPGTFGTEKA